MPSIDVTALDRELREGRIRPVYLIVGEEYYLVHSALTSVKEALARGGASETTFSAKDARPEDVLGSLRTIPLMGGRPLVIVREGEALGKEGRKDLVDALTGYLKKPLAEATLIVVAEKLDGRLKLVQQAAKEGAVVECKRLFDDKIPSWIGMQAKRRERQISQEAAKFMADLVGGDLGQLVSAIDRVILFAGERKVIELKDVEEAVADTHQRDVFELADAVGRRDLPRALSYLHNLIQAGQPPPLIVHMLARHFRILAKMKEISARTGDRAEIARYAGVNPYYAKGYAEQAKNFSRSDVRSAFAVLSRCDRDVKSSRLPKERVIERAIVEISKKRGAA